jgi:hypothetical protein
MSQPGKEAPLASRRYAAELWHVLDGPCKYCKTRVSDPLRDPHPYYLNTSTISHTSITPSANDAFLFHIPRCSRIVSISYFFSA